MITHLLGIGPQYFSITLATFIYGRRYPPPRTNLRFSQKVRLRPLSFLLIDAWLPARLLQETKSVRAGFCRISAYRLT